jgi:hypothetical protein
MSCSCPNLRLHFPHLSQTLTPPSPKLSQFSLSLSLLPQYSLSLSQIVATESPTIRSMLETQQFGSLSQSSSGFRLQNEDEEEELEDRKLEIQATAPDQQNSSSSPPILKQSVENELQK